MSFIRETERLDIVHVKPKKKIIRNYYAGSIVKLFIIIYIETVKLIFGVDQSARVNLNMNITKIMQIVFLGSWHAVFITRIEKLYCYGQFRDHTAILQSIW